MKTCAWCANEFAPKVSYQIYCSFECRDQATKNKIAERYQLTRIKNRSKRQRKCAGGCGTTLSIYNDSKLCSSCETNQKNLEQALKEIKRFFNYEKKDK